jgi:hypothetical protein
MSIINLDLLFNAITGVANPLIKQKIQRSETVIKLLKQFNLVQYKGATTLVSK